MEFNFGSDFKNVEKYRSGGWASVFKAFEKSLNRWVALKTLKVAVRGVPGARKRLEREAQAQANLDHQCILPIYRFEKRDDGKDFFVMKFVEGSDLRDCNLTLVLCHSLILGNELK